MALSRSGNLATSARLCEGAIRKLNAETQNKVGRRDISETDLFKQAFSHGRAQAREVLVCAA